MRLDQLHLGPDLKDALRQRTIERTREICTVIPILGSVSKGWRI
jgi:hypothetical protein